MDNLFPQRYATDPYAILTKLEQSCLGDSTKLALNGVLNRAGMFLLVFVKYNLQMVVCAASQDIEETGLISAKFALTSFVQSLKWENKQRYTFVIRNNVTMSLVHALGTPFTNRDKLQSQHGNLVKYPVKWDEITYPFPNFNDVGSLGMNKQFHLTLYNRCN